MPSGVEAKNQEPRFFVMLSGVEAKNQEPKVKNLEFLLEGDLLVPFSSRLKVFTGMKYSGDLLKSGNFATFQHSNLEQRAAD